MAALGLTSNMGGYWVLKTDPQWFCPLPSLRWILLNEVALAPVAGSFLFFTRLTSRSRLSGVRGFADETLPWFWVNGTGQR